MLIDGAVAFHDVVNTFIDLVCLSHESIQPILLFIFINQRQVLVNLFKWLLLLPLILLSDNLKFHHAWLLNWKFWSLLPLFNFGTLLNLLTSSIRVRRDTNHLFYLLNLQYWLLILTAIAIPAHRCNRHHRLVTCPRFDLVSLLRAFISFVD